jgi:hypothetical protein
MDAILYIQSAREEVIDIADNLKINSEEKV